MAQQAARQGRLSSQLLGQVALTAAQAGRSVDVAQRLQLVNLSQIYDGGGLAHLGRVRQTLRQHHHGAEGARELRQVADEGDVVRCRGRDQLGDGLVKPLQQGAEFGREEVEIGLAARVAPAEGGRLLRGRLAAAKGENWLKRESSSKSRYSEVAIQNFLISL